MSRARSLALMAALVLGLSTVSVIAPATPAGALNCPLGPSCPSVVVSSIGYISIYQMSVFGQTAPDYELFGPLSNPIDWSCSGATVGGGKYQVTCTPLPSNMTSYQCNVMYANANTPTPFGGQVRTTLDCDGVAPLEAQTSTVSGLGGFDSVQAVSTITVQSVTCTVDDGFGNGPVPDFVAGCGG